LKNYPESKVEVKGLTAKFYDLFLNVFTLGYYYFFIKNVIKAMEIERQDLILDMGTGTGRNVCLMKRYLSEKGKIIGIDISETMISQFLKKCRKFPNISIEKKRIDRPLPFKEEFTKVFISFVLHGFPQEKREVIIKNAYTALKNNGDFFILDYNEFSYEKSPFYVKWLFKFIECPYAFDFIGRNWKEILCKSGFKNFQEYFFMRGYIRLLKATK